MYCEKGERGVNRERRRALIAERARIETNFYKKIKKNPGGSGGTGLEKDFDQWLDTYLGGRTFFTWKEIFSLDMY